MLIDQTLIDRFNDQINVLEKQKASLEAAIGRASDNLKLLKANPGKNIEDVISLTSRVRQPKAGVARITGRGD
jgi:hypothetical protein